MSSADQFTHVLDNSGPTKDMESSGDPEPESASSMTSPSNEPFTKIENDSKSVVERGRQTDHNHVDEGQNSRQVDRKSSRKDSQHDVAEWGKEAPQLSLSPDTASHSVDQEYSDVGLKAPILDESSVNENYMDPTPKTPRQESSPLRGQPSAASETQGDEAPTSELQSIMDQFDEADAKGEEADHTDPDPVGSHLETPPQHPPRRSRLGPLLSTSSHPSHESTDNHRFEKHQFELAGLEHETSSIDTASKMPPVRTSSLPQSAQVIADNTNSSPNSSRTLPKLSPPDPDPEPDLPFDFHRFLEQLRHRTADPVAKFLRSFLIEFGKKQWMVHEQEKIVHDFLTFISNKMAQCEIWRGVSDAEFDNVKEGMEKLVMNRLYSQTFSPAIPAAAPLQGTKAKRKNTEKASALGRKGQHQEDIERDEILGQKVRIYGWVQEEHLDIPPVGSNGRRFLILAQQGKSLGTHSSLSRTDIEIELLKIKTYRAPRDKIICVLNCCKVIFGGISTFIGDRYSMTKES